ncbi:MAG: hypothetical protein IJ524_08125 [Bacteroidales bacterium]|nr:hypothetical protein [Bacteroidales bacterium]
MKTTKYLMMFVATAAIMFASCDKDENDQVPAIVGTWEYHETQPNIVRQYTETMSFKSDGTMSVQFTCYDTYEDNSTWHYGISLTGPYTIDGTNLKLKLYHNGVLDSEDSEFSYNEPDMSGEPEREYEFTFEISGDTLKIDKGDEVIFGHGGHDGVTEYIKK